MNKDITFNQLRSSKRRKQENEMTIRQTVRHVMMESLSFKQETALRKMSTVMGRARLGPVEEL